MNAAAAPQPVHQAGTTPKSNPVWPDRERCLGHALQNFTGRDVWTIGDAVEGVQIFGGTGSGKSSGSGRALATAFAAANFGGLVLTAKADDLSQWVKYLRALDFTDDQIRDKLIVVEPAGPKHPASVLPKRKVGGRETEEPLELDVCHAFNFLEYEFNANRQTADIVSLFLNTMPSGGAVSSEPYWDEALRELLTHAVDLAIFGTEALNEKASIRLEDLVSLIRSAPQSVAEARSSSWRATGRSRCWELLSAANERLAKTGKLPRDRQTDLAQTVQFWMHDFPTLNDKTRSIVVSSFTAKAVGLLRSPLRELLCGELSSTVDARPEVTHAGKIVLLNLPVKLYGEVGRFAQAIWKTVWQRATERRVGELDTRWSSHRPVFLWADESQYFVSKEDALFQQTARSALAATVFLSQNISNYYAALRGDQARVNSLLGNLQTKIFHANGDPTTNEWAEKLFAKARRVHHSANVGADGGSFGTQKQFEDVVWAKRFTTLAKGGPAANHKVEAFIFQAGRPWAGGTRDEDNEAANAVHCSFDQNSKLT